MEKSPVVHFMEEAADAAKEGHTLVGCEASPCADHVGVIGLSPDGSPICYAAVPLDGAVWSEELREEIEEAYLAAGLTAQALIRSIS